LQLARTSRVNIDHSNNTLHSLKRERGKKLPRSSEARREPREPLLGDREFSDGGGEGEEAEAEEEAISFLHIASTVRRAISENTPSTGLSPSKQMNE
jgi:hypothetical protein